MEGDTYTLGTRQLQVARAIIERGRERGFIEQGLTVALVTALQESKLRMYANDNPDFPGIEESLTYPHDAVGHDYDSLNMFQQRAMYWGSIGQLMNERYAIDAFYDALARVPEWWLLAPGVAAQTVQRSAYPDAYDKWADAAGAILAVFPS